MSLGGFARCMGAMLLCLLCVGLVDAADKIPITTSSEEARQLYLKGRELAEKLRGTEGRRFYEQAVAKDQNFAFAQLGLATMGSGGRLCSGWPLRTFTKGITTRLSRTEPRSTTSSGDSP